jgi:TonB family protein
LLTLSLVFFAVTVVSHAKPSRIAVLDFRSGSTGMRVASAIREAFRAKIGEPMPSEKEFEIVDPDQARVAALGIGYGGSLNLSLTEARDLGAALGCDFYFLGNAQTLRRSPSEGPAYYESYASIFLVSARTGKLLFWERPAFRSATQGEAERELLTSLATEDSRDRYRKALRRALEDERDARARAVEAAVPIIEVMSDEEPNGVVRAPRPYRRVKPPYPEAAAQDEVEAIVDVLVDVDERGEVARTEIARWAGYGLEESVLKTVRQLHFFPAMRSGQAIPMRVLLRYNFRKPEQ